MENDVKVEVYLDKIDMEMAEDLIKSIKQDYNLDWNMEIEDLFLFLLRYDYVEMVMLKKEEKEGLNENQK